MIYELKDATFLSEAIARQAADLDRGFNPETWLASPLNVATMDGRNIGLWECEGLCWQVHVIFEDRGAAALSVGKEMLKYMFDHYQPRVIKGLSPAHKRAARLFCRKLGFSSHGIIDTINGPVELFILECGK